MRHGRRSDPSAARAISRSRCGDPVFRHPHRSVRDRAEPQLRRWRGPAADAAAGAGHPRRSGGVPGAARPDLRDGRKGQTKARAGQNLDRIRWSAMDRRELHGRWARQPRPGRDAPPCLSRPRPIYRDHRADRRGDLRLSVGPGRSRSRSDPAVRQLGGEPRSGRVRALGDRPNGAAGRAAESETPRRAGNRLSQRRGGQAWRLRPGKRG